MDVFTTTPSQRQLGYGLLVLRLALGLVFIMHGGNKLFVAGFSGTTNMLTQMNIPTPGLLGPFLAIVEPIAGAALVLGLVTRIAGLVVAIDMICAILLFHRMNGFYVPMGIEFPMMLAASGLTLFALGGGSLSIDHAVARRRYNT